ncbi:PREDICTED: cytochrome P450 4C1-like [Polistes dominula]|uniref:Cytochrome P450 4C1-like n=1 Tax=Polistes dominula TaxID=743375 RepID=A0ABM1JB93_POLDO|nr:PREDICTED: cytochrome P450 4C1-like [Polistes dominula]
MFFTIFLGMVSFLFLLHCSIKYRRITRILEVLPGPKAYPIIGNLLHFQEKNEKLFKTFYVMDQKHYPTYKIWTFFITTVVLLHPKDIEVLMRSPKHITKSVFYKFLKPWLSTGLITSTGPKWQHRRKILTPTFHFNILKHFVVTLNEEARYLVSSMKEQGKGNPIIQNLEELITEHTLNAICETAMGTSLQGNGELEFKYRKAVHAMLGIVLHRSLRPWYFFDTIFALSPKGRLQEELLQTLHGFTNKIIAERKSFHEETKGKYLKCLEEIDENIGFSDGYDKNYKNPMHKKKLAMLDLLIAASWNGNQIDDEGIREEVDTFMFAGHDTTATALVFLLSLIAKHKDVQERIREEVNSIMNQENYQMTMSELQGFSYLERCIKESLRLYPSVHFVSRYLTEDMQLNKFLIPAGTNVRVNIFHLHRNPEFWPNPDVFDPDRFLPENISKRNAYCYIPFSAGLRNCIGQKYAMFEIKLMVAHILHNFYLEPVEDLDDIKLMGNIILRPATPLRVKFIPIKS